MASFGRLPNLADSTSLSAFVVGGRSGSGFESFVFVVAALRQ